MLDTLKAFFGRRRRQTAVMPGMSSSTIDPRLRRLDELDELERALKSILMISPERMNGRVFAISLDSIRSRYGNSWGYVGDKARRIARDTIDRMVGSGDIIAPVGVVDFALVIASTSKREAAPLIFRMDQAVMAAITGEDLGPLAVTAKEVTIGRDDELKFRAISFLDVQRARESDSGPGIDLEAEMAEDDGGDEEFPSADSLIRQVTFVSRPVMDMESRQTVMERLCASVPHLDESASEAEIVEGFDDPRLRAKLDLRALRQARKELKALYDAKAGRSIVAAVAFETLANAYTRGLYVKLCQRIPPPLRKYLAFELTDVPSGIASSRLMEIMGVLKPFGTGSLLRLDVGFKAFAALGDLGAIAVGPQGAFAATAETEAFCRAARSNGLKVFAGGLQNQDGIEMARAYGVAMIYGPHIN